MQGCFKSSLTTLRNGSSAERGPFYVAFFNYAIGLERLLKLRGHSVTTAHTMRGAIELAGESSFDLLISDVGLPDGNGMDLIRYLRIKQPMRGIAISGFGMDADIRKSIEAGFSEHLVKPVKLEKLEAAIARVMAS